MNNKLTCPIAMSPGVLLRSPQGVEAEISDLQYETGVYNAVTGLERPVRSDVCAVQVMHALLR